MLENRLKKGDWIKANIIGLGYYEVVSIDDFHIRLKCLKTFGGKYPKDRGHVTCCHLGTNKETNERIKINQSEYFSLKINRLNK